MARLPLWKKEWETFEKEWEEKAQLAEKKYPLKKLKVLPQMEGMTPETARGLKWKSLKWMITKDSKKEILYGFLKHPFKYGWEFIKSAFHSKPYVREGDFFLYGIKSLEAFEKLLENPKALFVLGFSYCHKPFECPSGRFSADCQNNPDHLVCQQCFIGKAVTIGNSSRTIPLFIPTIHYIGGKIFEIVHQNPGVPVIFMITACEMTLEMFGDWGNMVHIQGVGVRLDGRICNTLKAFELSERGIKPGLTVILNETQQKMIKLLKMIQ